MLLVEFLPVAFFVYNRNKIKSQPGIFLYVTNSLVFEMISKFSAIVYGSNILIFNLYGLFEGLFLCYFFLRFTKNNYLVGIVFSIFILFYFCCFSTNFPMDVSYVVSAILWIFLAVYSLISSIQNHKKFNKSLHLFIIAILFYNASSIVLFSITSLLFREDNFYWIFHNLINIFTLILISYSIWILPSKSEY